MVIAECANLINRELGPAVEATIYETILDEAQRIEDLTMQDSARRQELVTTYADLPLSGTDASVIAIAKRLGLTRVATLYRRHFAVVRTDHCPALELVS